MNERFALLVETPSFKAVVCLKNMVSGISSSYDEMCRICYLLGVYLCADDC